MKAHSMFVLTVVLHTALIATVASITLFPRTVAQLESDLSSASSSLITLYNALEAYYDDSEPSTQITTLHTDSQNAISALDSATTDVEATGPISPTDSSTIEGTVSSLKATITDICQVILTDIRPDGSSQLLEDLSQLNSAFNSLLSALQSSTSSPTSSQVSSLQSGFQLSCAFNSAGPHDPSFL